jgi:hypothetical protein
LHIVAVGKVLCTKRGTSDPQHFAAADGEQGSAMAAFEWMELQTLTSDITLARSRLTAARAGKDHRHIRTLEQEITAAEQRRARLLAFLTTHLADSAHGAPQATANEDAPPDPVLAIGDDEAEEDAAAAVTVLDDTGPRPVETELAIEVEPTVEPELAIEDEPADQTTADIGDADPMTSLTLNRKQEGDRIVWDQLTPGDLDRAKQEIEARRDEMLARHAEELRTLDADRDELAALDQAIAGFLRKFTAPSAAEVVRLGAERELRAAGRG